MVIVSAFLITKPKESDMPEEIVPQTAEPVNVESDPTPAAEVTESAPVEDGDITNDDSQTTDNHGSEPDELFKDLPPGEKKDKLVNELIGQRRKRQEAEQKLAYYESQQAATQPKVENQNTQPGPKLEDFEDYDDYETARIEYVAEQKFVKLNQAQQVEQQKMSVEAAYSAKMKKAVETDPTIMEKIQKAQAYQYPQGVNDAIIKNGLVDEIKVSEQAPEILAYIGDNPELTYKFASMDSKQIIREVARLEARLSMPKDQPKTNKISNTPTPIVPNSGGGVAPARGYADMSPEEFARSRNRQQFGSKAK